MTTHPQRLLLTTGLGLALIGTLALWPLPREAGRPVASAAARPAAPWPVPQLAAATVPAVPAGTATAAPAATPAAAPLPNAVDRLVERAQEVERRDLPDAAGTPVQRERLLRTTEFKYPYLLVSETVTPATAAGGGRVLERQTLVADQLIVKLRPDATVADLERLNAQHGARIRRKMLGPDLYLVQLARPGLDAVRDASVGYRQAAATVAYAEPDYVVGLLEVPDDPQFSRLWGLHNTGQDATTAQVEAGGTAYAANPMVWAPVTPTTGVAGTLHHCGVGGAGEFPPEVAGNIALIQRGGTDGNGDPLTFAAKTTNAMAAGAVAAVIYNNVTGPFFGTLNGPGDWIPVVSASDTDSAALLVLGAVPATVTIAPGAPGADIDAPEAWEIGRGSHAVKVGVIDTGVDYNHPDLVANIWTNPGEIAGNGIDDDGNGFVDDVHGWDFCNDDNDPLDDHFHGTHCAGTIGAVGNNRVGVAGVNWNVSIVALKFLSGQGGGAMSDALDAIYYATRMGCDLTSNSWGGGGYSQAMKDALDDAGAHDILLVAAAGNANNDNDAQPFYPCTYDSANVISVAATDCNDARASFSNYGLTTVDLGAPGVNIYSTYPTYMTAAMTSRGDPTYYNAISGTSMACPHVAGAAALLKSMMPSWTAPQIKAHLLANAEPIPALAGKCVTGGRLNIGRAAASETPLVRVWDVQLDDSAGNGDGIANPGETVQVTVTLRNHSPTPITGVSARLECSDPEASVVDAAAAFNDFAAFTEQAAQDPFAVAISPTCPTPHQTTFRVNLTTDAGPLTASFMMTIETSFQISGRVTLDGVPAPGVTINFAGPVRGTRVTDAAGAYMFGTPAGVSTVSATKAGWVASPPVRIPVPPSAAGVDFAFTSATVAGQVTDALTGNPLADATISYRGALGGSTTTAGDGRYQFSLVCGQPATLELRAGKAGYFNSAWQTVVVPPDATGVDFVLGYPEIEVTPTAFDVAGVLGDVLSSTLTIANLGPYDLSWWLQPAGTYFDTIERSRESCAAPGLAFAGTALWMRNGNTLYQLDPATGAELHRVEMPGVTGTRIAGLDWDGANLWTTTEDGRLCAVNPATGQIGKTLPMPGDCYGLIGVACGDGCLWVLGGEEPAYRRVWKMDPATGAVLTSWRLDDSFTGMPLAGPEYANGMLWIGKSNYLSPAQGYQLDAETGQQVSSFTVPYTDRQFVLDFANSGRNLWVYATTNDATTNWGVVHRLDAGSEPWLRIAPLAGTTPSLSSQTVALALNATQAGLGVHQTALSIESRDPDEPETLVPLTFTVEPDRDNRSPVIAEGASVNVSIDQNGEPMPFNLTLHATDPDNDALLWTLVTPANHGTAVAYRRDATLPVAYVPAVNYVGLDSFTVQVADGHGGVAACTVNVTVGPVNHPPTIVSAPWADPNPVTLPAGTTVHVVASDPDGDPLTYAWTKVSGAGTATFAAPTATDSSVTFSAAGTYVLRVTVTDGKGGSVASDVSVTVNPGAGVDPRADLNHDGVVNALDLQIVIANFGKTVGSPGCDARADANADGVVNALDLQIVVANFGQTVP